MAKYVVTRTQVIDSIQVVEADSMEEAIEFAEEDGEWEQEEISEEKFVATLEEDN